MREIDELEIRLDTLKQLISEIAKGVGPFCEILLHDLRNLDASCIAISGNVTGRKVGAPMTDLGLQILENQDAISNLINYSSRSTDGKYLRSSTFIVRNSKRKPIAFVCINFDISTIHLLRDMISQSFQLDLVPENIAFDQEVKETFPKDVGEILKSVVTEKLKMLDKPVSVMKKKDKLKLIEMLDESGVFKIRHSHYYVASVLNTSRYTIYNYLNEVRQLWHAPKKDTTSYVRVKDSLASGAGGR